MNILNKWKIWHWLFIAFVLRLYKLTQVYCIAKDGINYIKIANTWLNSLGFHPVWPPLYPLLVNLIMRLGLNSEICGGIISVIFGVLTVGLVYIMVRDIFGEQLARITAIFAVFQPFLVRYSAEVLADSVFTFLILLMVYIGWIVIHKKNLLLVLSAGVTASLAYLTKPEGIFLLPIVSVWWLLDSGYGIYRRLIYTVCTWVVFIIFISPYMYVVYKQTGQWMISQKQTIVFSTELQKEGFSEEYLDISPWEYAQTNPENMLKKTINGLKTLTVRFADAYDPFLFVLLVIGLFNKWKSEERKCLLYFSSFFVPYFIGYAVLHPGRRYLVNWVPMFLLLAGAGYYKTVDYLGNIKFIPQSVKKYITGVVLVCIILLMLPKTLESLRKDGFVWKEAGIWIKEHSENKPVIISEDIRVSFYAEGTFYPWDSNKFREADYIVAKDPDIVEQVQNVDCMEIYTTPEGAKIYHVDNR